MLYAHQYICSLCTIMSVVYIGCFKSIVVLFFETAICGAFELYCITQYAIYLPELIHFS